MSDLSIPGVNSTYTKMVDDLVKTQKVKLDDLEKDLTALKDRKKIWQELSQKTTLVRDSAKGLFGYQNPFNQKKAISSDETVMTATADRNAADETVSFEILHTAQTDKFLSKPLPKDYRIPAGTYGFSVGEKKLDIRYAGGKLSDFAEVLTKKSGGMLRAQVIPNTTSTQIMSVESLKPGAVNRLVFLDKAAETGIEMGFLKESGQGVRKIELAEGVVQPWQAAFNRQKITVAGGTMKILAGAEGSIPINPPVKADTRLVLEMEVRVVRNPVEQPESATPPPGPSVPPTGNVTLAGITVEGERSLSTLPRWTPPPPPVVKNDPVVFFAEGGGVSVPLPGIDDATEFRKVRIPISEYVKDLSALNFRNGNTHRDYEIRSISVFDPETRGDFNPANAVTQASDAVLKMNGIEIVRDTNEIKDLVPGVTLNLLKPTEKPVEIRVEPDKKAVKDALITFVGNYNQVITQINILTRTDESVISEIEYFTDEEREKAAERLGLFQGDFTLMQMKTRMQSIMMESYRSSPENPFTVLSQIGISTDSRKPGSGTGYEASRLRGYLEIQESRLDEILKGDLTPVKDLFGFDTDGDLIMDSGAAVNLDTFLKPFVETGGTLAVRQSGIDREIKSTDREIESYKEYLVRYEQDLRKKYGQMEGTLGSLERASKNIENFSSGYSKK